MSVQPQLPPFPYEEEVGIKVCLLFLRSGLLPDIKKAKNTE